MIGALAGLAPWGHIYFFCEKKVQKAPGTLRERSPDPSALLLYVGATVRVRRVSAPAASAAVSSRAIHLPERVSNEKGSLRSLLRGIHFLPVVFIFII